MLTYDVAPAVFDAVAPGVVVAVKTGDRIPTSGPPYAYGTARYEPPAVFTALVDQPCERMFCVGGRLPAIGDPRRGASIPCDSCFDGTAPVVLRTHCDQQCDVYPCKRTDANCSGGYRSLSVKVACVPIVDKPSSAQGRPAIVAVGEGDPVDGRWWYFWMPEGSISPDRGGELRSLDVALLGDPADWLTVPHWALVAVEVK